MADGVRIKNLVMTTQIDENYIGMALSAKGTVTLIGSSGSGTVPTPAATATVVVTGALNPILAVNCPSTVAVTRVAISGTTYTFTLRARSAANVNADYWVFDEMEKGLGIGSNFGLKIRRASDNRLVYDAGASPLRIVGLATVADPTQAWLDTATLSNIEALEVSMAVPAGRVYAGVQGSYCRVRMRRQTGDAWDGGPPPYKMRQTDLMNGVKVASSVITAGLFYYDRANIDVTSTTPETTDFSGGIMNLIVDVTGY